LDKFDVCFSKKFHLVGGNQQQNDLNATSALKLNQLSRLGQQILPTHLSGVKIQISDARTSVINKSIGSFRISFFRKYYD
ncbi:8425_t:CDS:1, partial [Gigaspora margarita]